MSIEPKAGGLGSRHFRVNTDPLIHVIIVGLLDMCVCVCVCMHACEWACLYWPEYRALQAGETWPALGRNQNSRLLGKL